MQQFRKRALFSSLLVLGLSLSLAASALAYNRDDDDDDRADRREGAVFVGTNHTNLNPVDPPIPGNRVANQVVMYHRAADGSLRLAGYFPTGGHGSGPGQRFAGDGLGSSHSIQLSKDARWLFVTNAGSDTVSVFRVRDDGLELTDQAPTGNGSEDQRFPNSVTQHDDLVYVLNAAGQGSITGFRLRPNGRLQPLHNSTRILNANQRPSPSDALLNPAQVSFTPDGQHLVVSIKDGIRPGGADVPPTGPGRILVFRVQGNGRPSPTFTQNDLSTLTGRQNPGPFGFSFDSRGNLLVALFVGGPNLTSAAGSFQINQNGTLTPITPLVAATNEVDLCWLENNGRYAFGANYTTGTISSYRIDPNGRLSLLNPRAGTALDTDFPAPENPGARSQGATPLDLAISHDGKFLYNVLPGSGRVAAWRIKGNGSLVSIGEFPGLGQTVDGDHAPSDFSPLESPAGIAAY
ncbi:MAG: lactonase family protein [Candidatus Tectimicrobiota bacterium]